MSTVTSANIEKLEDLVKDARAGEGRVINLWVFGIGATFLLYYTHVESWFNVYLKSETKQLGAYLASLTYAPLVPHARFGRMSFEYQRKRKKEYQEGVTASLDILSSYSLIDNLIALDIILNLLNGEYSFINETAHLSYTNTPGHGNTNMFLLRLLPQLML